MRHSKPAADSARRNRQETEFLPAALEILEKPASPIRTALIWVICSFAAAAIVWSYVGKLEIVAVAQGKIQPHGRVKVVQSLEAGKTIAIHAGNGSRVSSGQKLVELDATEALAELATVTAKLQILKAQIARGHAELEAVRAWEAAGVWQLSGPTLPELVLPEDTPEDVRFREESLLATQLEELSASIQNLHAQKMQQKASVERLSSMISAQEALVSTLATRVNMRTGLADVSAGSRSVVLDALESQQQEQAELAELAGQLTEAHAAARISESEATKIVKTFIAETMRKYSEAATQVAELEQAWRAAQRRADLTIITSPIDGVVQASSLTTVGQVVVAGAEIMRVVPEDATLEIEAYLPNKDIGFVSIGQPVIIKVEAFPFTRYGIIDGEVSLIARDAIPEPDAQQLEGQPTRELQSTIPIGNVQRVQNLVFPITVKPSKLAIDVDGSSVALSPGMAVTAEIKTGTRRIIDYLLSPISQVSSEALQER